MKKDMTASRDSVELVYHLIYSGFLRAFDLKMERTVPRFNVLKRQIMNKKTALQLLREAVEQKAGRKMATPKDFNFLSEHIFEEIHTRISPSTLKRIWGYLQNDNTPRSTSLNILANYVGYDNWDRFLASAEKEYGILPEEQPSDRQPDTPIKEQDFKERKSKLKSIFLSAAALLIAAVLFTAMWHFFKSTDTSQQQTLHKGQHSYATMDDCLKLFGIITDKKKHYQPIPHLNNIYVWCPTYQQPVWQNDGDSIQLLPTITERWTPDPELGIPQVQVNLYRSRAYVKALANRELRLTFMRGVIDSTFTFLGVYRLSPRSNEDSIVWERIADECDLNNLGLLEQFTPAPIPVNLEIEDDSLFRSNH